MVTLTCECTRGVSPGGESVLICQVPSAPPHLPPGVYTVTCQSEDDTLSGRQLRFEWTGLEWIRRCGGRQSSGNGRLPETDKEGWNYALKSWLNKPFVVTKKEKRSSLFSTRPQLSAQLVVSKRGFLPREKLAFDLTLKNCHCSSSSTSENVGGQGQRVTRVKVELVQKMTSRAREDGKKTVTTTISSLVQKELTTDNCQETRSQNNLGGEVRWASEFLIPDDILPSIARDLTRKIPVSVDVSYMLVFALPQTADGRRGLRGEAPIVIGRANNNGISRLAQAVQIEAPPSYTSLVPSGRRSSIESLPPTYEAAVQMLIA